MDNLIDKLKKKCSVCGKEIEFDLPNDDIFRRFTMTCKDCARWISEDDILKCSNRK